MAHFTIFGFSILVSGKSRSTTCRYVSLLICVMLVPYPLGLNFVKSQSMFCFAAPEVWNVLPLSVRHSDSVSQFKRHLKSHYFSLAFCNLDDL